LSEGLTRFLEQITLQIRSAI